MSDIPENIALIEKLLLKYDRADVPGYARSKFGVVVSHATVMEVYERIATTKLGRKRASRGGTEAAPCPADFATHVGASNTQLQEHYGVALWVITRWRRESGVSALRMNGGRNRKDTPADLVQSVQRMTHKELCLHYGASGEVVRRWLNETGLQARRPVYGRTGGHRPAPFSEVKRDVTAVGRAVDHLRRLGAVYRCNDKGAPSIGGKFWNRGGHVLTDADIIERAERNGWRADAWKALAA